MVLLQFLEHLLGFLDNCLWHACHFGHMDTKAVRRAAFYQLSDKQHRILELFYRNIVILYPAKDVLHLVQFMVVCCKKRFWLCRVLVEEFGYGPGNRDTVIRA